MPTLDSSGSRGKTDKAAGSNKSELTLDKDLLMDQILDNLNNTPLGQVLKTIASLPEIRQEKVLDIRRQISQGQYDLNQRLDIALEKVLEDLTSF